jgi:hypothetical protein
METEAGARAALPVPGRFEVDRSPLQILCRHSSQGAGDHPCLEERRHTGPRSCGVETVTGAIDRTPGERNRCGPSRTRSGYPRKVIGPRRRSHACRGVRRPNINRSRPPGVPAGGWCTASCAYQTWYAGAPNGTMRFGSRPKPSILRWSSKAWTIAYDVVFVSTMPLKLMKCLPPVKP